MNYWDKANTNKAIAKAHTELMAQTKADLINASVANSKIYDFCNKPKLVMPAVFKLINTDTVSAIMMQPDDKRIGVLNFASFKEPGGKFLDGSSAQEECLCHASFLYNVLYKFQDSYYNINKQHLNILVAELKIRLFTDESLSYPYLFLFKRLAVTRLNDYLCSGLLTLHARLLLYKKSSLRSLAGLSMIK